MLKKVKNWLGIEGVKLELILPEKIKETSGVVEGSIRFYSMNQQTVNHIKVTLIERFSRGRKKEKMTDEYRLGEITLNNEIEIPEEGIVTIDFNLPFQPLKSDMDVLEDRNLIYKGLVKMAKSISAVKSEYYIQAEASVKGTALNPFSKQFLIVE